MKKKLRNNMLHRIETMSTEEKYRIEQNIYKQLFHLKEWKEAKIIGITYSQTFEWNTIYIMKEAWRLGKKVSIPKTNIDRKSMIFHIIHHEHDVIQGAYGIFEPKDATNIIDKSAIDLMFVPGVLFDASGYRIGYGGGYYDRY